MALPLLFCVTLVAQCNSYPPPADDIPRFIHHLGPRYYGSFQDTNLSKFLTYEASTSINMFLANVQLAAALKSPLPTSPVSGNGSLSTKAYPVSSSSIVKVVKDGLGLPQAAIVFAISPLNCTVSGYASGIPISGGNGVTQNGTYGAKSEQARKEFVVQGDVYVVKAKCLDNALWRVGGVAVALRLVQVAQVRFLPVGFLRVLTDYHSDST